jgi:L-asparaginase
MHLALVATGGTIAWHEERGVMLSGDELASMSGCRFDEVLDVASKPSWDLSIGDMEGTAAAIRRAIDRGAEGVVVSHGTDTLEEAAWLADLTLGAERRARAAVVFTGAMRFADADGADGPKNIADAVALAGDGPGRGVQVVVAGRVHAARWVVKTDAQALDAFESFGMPAVAPAPPLYRGLDRAVALLKVGPTAMPSLPTGLRGLVLEGTGVGHVPSVCHEEIQDLVQKGVAVVMASRSRGVSTRVGDAGVLGAGDLTAEKAAVALMVALGSSRTVSELCAWWSELLGVQADS